VLKRLFALLVLVVLVGAAAFLWRQREAGAPGADVEAREKLGALRDEFRGAKTKAAVMTAFSLNRRLSAYDIQVDASDNMVTLRGTVGDEDTRRQAARVAASVPGVGRVQDELHVDPSQVPAADSGRTLGETLDDRALEGKIKLAFSLDRNLENADITVRAYRRTVVLGGEAATAAQADVALTIARQVPDAGTVTDEIRVRGGAPGGPPGPGVSGATPAPLSSTDERVAKALAANDNLAPFALKVQHQGDRPVITGRVRTGAEKDLAGALAREASGGSVDNQVEVRPE